MYIWPVSVRQEPNRTQSDQSETTSSRAEMMPFGPRRVCLSRMLFCSSTAVR